MDTECPQCHSNGIDSELIIEEDGGDYAGEMAEYWRYVCYDCGHTWDQRYDWTIDPNAIGAGWYSVFGTEQGDDVS